MTFVGLLGEMSRHQSVLESASKTPGLTTCFRVFCVLSGLSLRSKRGQNCLHRYALAGVDTGTLEGKVMVGYQGWFNAAGDGANLGWTHWARNRTDPFGPNSVTIDMWPDMSEYGVDERFETEFRQVDGRKAEVFSSHTRETVIRHFEWMRDYGIDGAFVQRFARGAMRDDQRHHKNVVLSHIPDRGCIAVFTVSSPVSSDCFVLMVLLETGSRDAGLAHSRSTA